MPKAFISGCAGLALTPDEQAFFRDAQPAGLILFTRNCETPDQVRRLTASFRELLSHDPLVLVDQEGGRVQRMAPPYWRALPPAAAFGEMYQADREGAVAAAEAVARLCAEDLTSAGINVNCVPVLDVPSPDGHEIIGDRAYANKVDPIVDLGRAVVRGHLAGGVIPVVKHLPGHGRATADSHLELPQVDTSLAELEGTDFSPFLHVDAPAGMTAHVVYSAIDPAECASTSSTVIRDIIRGTIQFGGLLMSDDLSMKALSGDMAGRTRRVLDAGCDLALHCNGDMDEMQQVAKVAPVLSGRAKERLEAAFAAIATVTAFDVTQSEAVLNQIVNGAAV